MIWGATSGSTSLFLFSIVFIKAGVVRVFSAPIALKTFYLKYGKVANPEIFGDLDPDLGEKKPDPDPDPERGKYRPKSYWKFSEI